MDTKELLKKVRKIEIKTRRLSDHIFGGAYHSTFKGRGMTFSEVRPYQFGDDVRAIDWNVTARYNSPHIKVFEEERELTFMLMIDISGSCFFGTDKKLKQEIITELSATLAFSALQNNDKVGLVLFSDTIELFIAPKKGKSHVLRIIRALVEVRAMGKKTDITQALEFISKALKKKAIVFMLSDFMDTAYAHTLKIIGKKHDLTGIRVFDAKEKEIPNIGMVAMQDPETTEVSWIDTSSKKVRASFAKHYQISQAYFKDAFAKSGSGSFSMATHEDYVKKLLTYFKTRG